MDKEIEQTFVSQFLRGIVSVEDIDDFIDAWHNSNSNVPLHEYLGMTMEEYKTYVQTDHLILDDDIPF